MHSYPIENEDNTTTHFPLAKGRDGFVCNQLLRRVVLLFQMMPCSVCGVLLQDYSMCMSPCIWCSWWESSKGAMVKRALNCLELILVFGLGV
jgi:hypothetical protein